MKIFVSIASYRDYDCVNTLNSLFVTKSNKHDIKVVILNNYKKENERFCDNRAQILNVQFDKCTGVCSNRNEIQKYITNEDFYFQIDSHTRFVKNWDNLLIEFWEDLKDDKAVLSTYPLAFDPCLQWYEEGEQSFIVPSLFNEQQILCFTQKTRSRSNVVQPSYYIGANMLFAPILAIKEVPYDPNLYFWGEEISLSVRFFTYGYNVYVPKKNLIYHWYPHKPHTQLKRKASNLHSFDFVQKAKQLKKKSDAIILNLLKTNNTRYKYGLGTKRTVQDFEKRTGINFQNQTIHRKDARLVR